MMFTDKNFILTFIRHAESCGNAGIYYEDKYQQDDPPLSPAGLRQAQMLADSKLLDNVDYIFSSTLIRTVQTVYPSAVNISREIILLPELMEVNTRIAGTEYSRLRDNYPLAIPCLSEPSPAGGPLLLGDESVEMIVNRAQRCVEYFHNIADEGNHIAVITHGSYFGYLLRAALGFSLPEIFCWQVDNCSATRIIFRKNEIPKLSFVNYTGHLFHAPVYPTFPKLNQEVIL